jgi:hypothetical protein
MTGYTAEFERLLSSLRVDSGKVQRELDWYPSFTLRQGLQATADWYVSTFSKQQQCTQIKMKRTSDLLLAVIAGLILATAVRHHCWRGPDNLAWSGFILVGPHWSRQPDLQNAEVSHHACRDARCGHPFVDRSEVPI